MLTDPNFTIGKTLTAVAPCASGQRVISGGYTFTLTANERVFASASFPSSSNTSSPPNGWTATLVSTGPAGSVTLTTYAICVA